MQINLTFVKWYIKFLKYEMKICYYIHWRAEHEKLIWHYGLYDLEITRGSGFIFFLSKSSFCSKRLVKVNKIGNKNKIHIYLYSRDIFSNKNIKYTAKAKWPIFLLIFTYFSPCHLRSFSSSWIPSKSIPIIQTCKYLQKIKQAVGDVNQPTFHRRETDCKEYKFHELLLIVSHHWKGSIIHCFLLKMCSFNHNRC